MRNRYGGTCYHCRKPVAPGDGHFEQSQGWWRMIHAGCVFIQRAEKRLAAKENSNGH